jgi:hypothetical protein
MVLHRAAAGGTEAGAALAGSDVKDLPTAPDSAASPGEGENERTPDPAAGYQALQGQGLTHQDIIDKLAAACVDVIDDQQRSRNDRAGDIKGGF